MKDCALRLARPSRKREGMGEGKATGDGLSETPALPKPLPPAGGAYRLGIGFPYNPTRFANHLAAASGLSFAASSRSTR